MASAGRILIMPKGNYDSNVTYEMLDLVKHNGVSWIAKKASVGIEPSEANSEYWQDVFDIRNINTEIHNLKAKMDDVISLKWDAETSSLQLYLNGEFYKNITLTE